MAGGAAAAGVGGGDVAPEARGGYGWLWVAMGLGGSLRGLGGRNFLVVKLFGVIFDWDGMI